MPKFGLALDIDDTLAETALTITQLTLAKFGHPDKFSPLELIKQYDQPGKIPAWNTFEIQQFIYQMHHNLDLLLELPTTIHSQEMIPQIQEFCPIRVYLTSRTPELETVTQSWLRKHHFPEAPIIMRSENISSPLWKIEYLRQQVPSYVGLVDNALPVFTPSSTGIPFTFFWFNRYAASVTLPKGVISFDSWKDFPKRYLPTWEPANGRGS